MHLQTRTYFQSVLAHVDQFIRRAVHELQASGNFPTDSLRGLVITHEEASQLINQEPMHGLWNGATQRPPLFELDVNAPPDDRLVTLTQTFMLSNIDLNILLLALAPLVDRRYERLYAYLQDDVSLKLPTVNLIMNLLGVRVEERLAIRQRLGADSPLRKFSLVYTKPDNNAPIGSFLAHHVLVDQRIMDYLFGDDTFDIRLKQAVKHVYSDDTFDHINPQNWQTLDFDLLPIVLLEGKPELGQKQTAHDISAQQGYALIEVDLRQLQESDQPFALLWNLTLREARLNNAALLLTCWDSILDESRQPASYIWQDIIDYRGLIFIATDKLWESHQTQRTRQIIRYKFTLPDFDTRLKQWESALAGHQVDFYRDDLVRLATKFNFTPAQIKRAFLTALDLATTDRTPITINTLYTAAQAHSTLRLGRLARAITPLHIWDDLILPDDQIAQLREIRNRAEYVHTVQDVWGYGNKIAPRPGISALFAGESGTGKTMSAEVIANELGLLLYKIDLSAVVSKYIGETEKNLSVIFEEAQASSSILFFDEADALFGKRSEVKDARDRYANIETAYLLQQIEDYDGIAILATNLRQNLDDAFTRRLDFVITYPFPDAEARAHIWTRHFPPNAPLHTDVDFQALAERFPLAGGNIRNVAISAAYLAASDNGIISNEHILTAIRREYQKMGRLTPDEI